MVRFLIHRPIAVTMAFLALLLIGIATTTSLPVSLMPDIDIPVVSVRVSYSDMPARQLENTVVKSLRNVLKEVNHVEEMRSETRDGSAWIELRFRHGTPIDLASVEVNEKVDKAMNFLPREMKRPEVIRASASDIPVFYLMITQKKAELPVLVGNSNEVSTSPSGENTRGASSAHRGGQGGLLELSNFTSQVIRKRLEQLPEVALVDMSGLQYPEIQITPHRSFLQSGAFSIAGLEQALQNNNIDLGNLLIRDGQYQYNIRFNTRLRDVADIGTVPVNLNGKVALLKELADIQLQPQKQAGNVRYNLQPAVSLAIIKQSDARMADLKDELEFLVSRFSADYPALEFSVTRDQSKLLEYSINNLGQSLLIGGVLAFLTLFVFLRERRAPWLIGISIPVSLMIALLFFYLAGLSINIISLSGLILGVGMMIDNSIIVIDNITQHRQRTINHKRQTTNDKPQSTSIKSSPNVEFHGAGKPQTTNHKHSNSSYNFELSNYSNLLDISCINGTNEVIRPLISSVLTTCAVFIPLIFMKGMAGALFFDQAVAVSIGLVVSLLVSITLLPTLYRLFYKKSKSVIERNKKQPVYFQWYEKGLKFVLRRQAVSFFTFISLIGIAILMWKQLPVSQFPEISQDETLLEVDWDEPVTLEENNDRMARLLAHLKEKPEYVIEEAGHQQYLLNTGEEAGISENKLFLKATSPAQLQRLKNQLSLFLQNLYPLASVNFTETENLFNLAFGKQQAPLVVRFSHFNPGQDEYVAELTALQEEMESLFPGKVSSKLITRKLILLETDPEKLLFYQVDNNDLYREIKSAFNVNRIFTINDNNMYVPVNIGNRFRTVYDIVQNITVQNKNWEQIPLSGLVKMSAGTGLKNIVAGRESEYFPVWLDIDADELEQTKQIIEQEISEEKFDAAFGGSILSGQGMLRELLVIIGISLLLLYFILAAQFESFVLPLIVLLEVPIDLFGVFILLKLFGAGMNIMSAIGIIVMAGIIINDSILKIDTINKLMDSGNSLIKSIFEGGRRRLKPIIMTSLTTILAMTPFLFQKGMGAELQKPLALAVIGGMLIGTLVSLFFIPLMYFWLRKRFEEV